MTGEKKTKTSKAAGKTAPKTAGKAPVKAASKAPVKTAAKAPVKAASKAHSSPSRTAGKAASKEKTPQYIMSKAEWDAFIGKMDQLLQDEKSEIINTLVSNNNDFKEIVDGMDPKDLADIASDDIDRKMIEMLGSQELKRLKMIESAQTRIKQGKYGHCIKCDRPIPPERLEAIPYALMCIECKSEEERRNR
jgi:RNA polymerase-binding protein DksA